MGAAAGEMLKALCMVSVLLLLGLVGCGSSSSSDGAAGCDAIEAGLAHDKCLGDQILALPAAEVAAVEATAPLIQDGMVRQAAVSRWVADHANEIPKETGERLCNMLTGRDQSYCLKRFLAVHLQR